MNIHFADDCKIIQLFGTSLNLLKYLCNVSTYDYRLFALGIAEEIFLPR